MSSFHLTIHWHPFLVFRLSFKNPAADKVDAEEPQWLSPTYIDGLSFFPQKIVKGLWVLWQHPTLWSGYDKRPLGSSLDFVHTDAAEILLIRASNHNGVTHSELIRQGGVIKPRWVLGPSEPPSMATLIMSLKSRVCSKCGPANGSLSQLD